VRLYRTVGRASEVASEPQYHRLITALKKSLRSLSNPRYRYKEWNTNYETWLARDERGNHRVLQMCRVLGVSPSGLYA